MELKVELHIIAKPSLKPYLEEKVSIAHNRKKICSIVAALPRLSIQEFDRPSADGGCNAGLGGIVWSRYYHRRRALHHRRGPPGALRSPRRE
jgi:hypothetical protein